MACTSVLYNVVVEGGDLEMPVPAQQRDKVVGGSGQPYHLLALDKLQKNVLGFAGVWRMSSIHCMSSISFKCAYLPQEVSA